MILLARFSRFGARVLEALRAAFSPRRLPVNAASTASVWVMGAVSFYCMLRAAGAAVPLPLALAAIKKSVLSGMDMPLDESMDFQLANQLPLFHTEDQKEGMRAFLERRKPVFKGK